MNKKKIIIFVVLVLIIMLIPIPIQIKNGNKEYRAILYKYVKIHQPSDQSSTGYEDGWELKILGIHVAGVTNVYVETAKIEVVKNSYNNEIEYSKYLEVNDRIIYLSNSLREVYFSHGDYKDTLKKYITTTWQSMDDSIKKLTNIMENPVIIKDGGTKIYKSMRYDITIVTCNTVSGNRDIFVGDYNMEFDVQIMCKR